MPKSEKKKDRAYRKAQAALRRVEAMKKRGQSKWVEVRDSEIHGRGVYAACDIAEDTEVIEYVGEPVDKEESERRAWAQMAKAEETGDAAVYIFTLNDDWDLDGSVDWNIARLINHSLSLIHI